MSPPLVVYTDGSGTVAHLPCGAGVVVYDGDVVMLEASRHLGLGTNNHAELSAVRVALAITEPWRDRPLVIRSDSLYTIGALTAPCAPDEWRPNARLIGIIRRALVGRVVSFEHVRGHAGDIGNERADQLALLVDEQRGEIAEVRTELRAANDRLVQAWKDGYTVPVAEDDEPTGASDPLLSPAQTEWLDQWEDPQGRARWEAFLVRRMRAGASADASIADAELQVIRGQESLLTPQPATSAVTLG